MDDENLVKLSEFEAEVQQDGSFAIPNEKFAGLYKKGYKKIKIRVFGSVKETLTEQGIDYEIFEEVKKMQSLPDAAALGLFDCKGKLDISFSGRIKAK